MPARRSSDLDSSAVGVDGDQADFCSCYGGARDLLARPGRRWSDLAYLKASNTDVGDEFGYSVSLDGDTLAVGALGEDSSAVGVDGDQADNSAGLAGAVYVLARTGGGWTLQSSLKASNRDELE